MNVSSSATLNAPGVEVSPNKPKASQQSLQRIDRGSIVSITTPSHLIGEEKNQPQQQQKQQAQHLQQSSHQSQQQTQQSQSGQLEGQSEVKVSVELQLSPGDFEKKFQKIGDCLQRSEFYETWKYESSGETYIVKKFVKLDEQKWRKLVSSYNLQYSLACSSDLFLKPYKLVAFSLLMAPAGHHNRLSQPAVKHPQTAGQHSTHQLHNNSGNNNSNNNSQPQRRWQLYVIYNTSFQALSVDKIFLDKQILISDIDILYIIVQLFRVGQQCAAKNFPLINWKFSNLLLQLKPAKSASTPGAKVLSESLKAMDLYDYFGIENRDPRDPLLPPELRIDPRNQQPAHFQNGNLEQSSIFMTGMMVALLIQNKINLPVVNQTVPAANAPANSSQAPKTTTTGSLLGVMDQGKKQKNDGFRGSNAFSAAAAVKEGEATAAAANAVIDTIISSQTLSNPLIHALAMIIKVTISPNPSERPTFSSALDVVRNVFGETIDSSALPTQIFTNAEKRIILFLELSNTLIEQQAIDSATVELGRAKKKLSSRLKKEPISQCVKAFDLLTTGNMFAFQGRSHLAIKQYFDALREIQSIEETQEDQEEFYYNIFSQILLQLGICSFKITQLFKASLYFHECLKILRIQEKNMQLSNSTMSNSNHIQFMVESRNSKKCKFSKLMAFALMWKSMTERVIGKFNFKDSDLKLRLLSRNKEKRLSTVSPTKTETVQQPQELMTIKEALNYCRKGTREYAKVFLVKLRILSTHGSHEKALKGAASLLAEIEALNSSNEPDLLIMECHYVMGIIYFQKNNITEAIKELLEAQKIFEARGEANHPDCIPVYQKLSKCYARLGKISQASSLYERAIWIQEKSLKLMKEQQDTFISTDSQLTDSRFSKNIAEEPESLLMYNYCLHLKEESQSSESQSFSLELLQNNKINLSPTPVFVNSLIDRLYSSLQPDTLRK